ncbi:hypothetical protein Q669_00945 [Labrenzia sp. C1B10]|nr:hypothetical protein Q669_00945 [Labrenzia sp. C1B10]ERS00874.1 hypothetical protein Q675_08700 [Labrenzia sp. C1B70]
MFGTEKTVATCAPIVAVFLTFSVISSNLTKP